MQNAHLRMGKLTFVKQTRDTITDVSVHLNRLVAERPAEPRLATDLHRVSVFGGDQEISRRHSGGPRRAAFRNPRAGHPSVRLTRREACRLPVVTPDPRAQAAGATCSSPFQGAL